MILVVGRQSWLSQSNNLTNNVLGSALISAPARRNPAERIDDCSDSLGWRGQTISPRLGPIVGRTFDSGPDFLSSQQRLR